MANEGQQRTGKPQEDLQTQCGWKFSQSVRGSQEGSCGAGPTRSGAAPFDPNNTEGSMTIRPMEETDQAMAEDVLKTNAVVDVFRVAKAEKTPGYDTYHYVYGAPFDGVFGTNDQTPENADDWDAMAQEAAKVVFDKNVSRLKQGDLKGTVEGLEPGLYLLMARGGTAADSVADFRKDVTDDKGNTTIVTYANSPEYEYTFKPQLISLPMKGNRVPVNPTDPPNTADSGDWNYNLEVYLKFERSVRYGSLTIRKVLSSYESETDIPNDPVTFVFQVDGETQGTAENSAPLPSYHAVDSLTFTAAGEDTVTFGKIPVRCTAVPVMRLRPVRVWCRRGSKYPQANRRYWKFLLPMSTTTI